MCQCSMYTCDVCVRMCLYSLIHYFCEWNNDFPTLSCMIFKHDEFHSERKNHEAEGELLL